MVTVKEKCHWPITAQAIHKKHYYYYVAVANGLNTQDDNFTVLMSNILLLTRQFYFLAFNLGEINNEKII